MLSRIALITAVTLPALLGVAACSNKPADTALAGNNTAESNVTAATATFPMFNTSRKEAGKAAPMTAIFDGPGGTKTTLAKFAGKPFLVFIWSVNIQDSVDLLPSLDALAGEGKIAVAAVNSDPRPTEAFPDIVSPYMASHKFKTLVDFRDEDQNLKRALNSPIPPEAILYDSQGKQVLQISYGSFADPKVRELIAEAK